MRGNARSGSVASRKAAPSAGAFFALNCGREETISSKSAMACGVHFKISGDGPAAFFILACCVEQNDDASALAQVTDPAFPARGVSLRAPPHRVFETAARELGTAPIAAAKIGEIQHTAAQIRGGQIGANHPRCEEIGGREICRPQARAIQIRTHRLREPQRGAKSSWTKPRSRARGWCLADRCRADLHGLRSWGAPFPKGWALALRAGGHSANARGARSRLASTARLLPRSA